MIDLTYCPKNKKCEIHLADGQIIETDEEVCFNYVRGQIARWQLQGAFIIFEGSRYDITPDGEIPNWPKGLFDENEKLCSYILRHGMYKDAEINENFDLAESLVGMDVEPEIVVKK